MKMASGNQNILFLILTFAFEKVLSFYQHFFFLTKDNSHSSEGKLIFFSEIYLQQLMLPIKNNTPVK